MTVNNALRCGKRYWAWLLACALAVLAMAPGRAAAQPTVGFKVASAIANPTMLTVEVVLSAKSAQAITVQVDTVPGTATSPEHYTAISQGTLLFAPDTISQTFTVTGITAAGNGKTFSIQLSEPVNANLGTSLMLVSISTGGGGGGGGGGTVQFESSSWTVNEGAGPASITVRMDGTPTGPVSVVCSTTTGGTATAGVDFTSNAQTLTWQANEAGTAKTFTIQILNDMDVESNETINLTLSGALGGTIGAQGTATLTIMDDDVPSWGIKIVAEKSAICAGGKNSPPHQSTITATLIDPGTGTPLVTVHHSADSYEKENFIRNAGRQEKMGWPIPAFLPSLLSLNS